MTGVTSDINTLQPKSPLKSSFQISLKAWLQVSFVLTLFSAGLITGCKSLTDRGDEDDLLSQVQQAEAGDADDELADGGKKVRWDGGGVILGSADSLAYSPKEFVNKVQHLYSQQRFASIKQMVRQYPDIALKCLQDPNPLAQDQSALKTLAAIFDELWCENHVRPWQDYLTSLAKSDGRTKASLRRRREFWSHLTNSEPETAIELRLVDTLPNDAHDMLKADCLRLEAIALMMLDEHSDAIGRLKKSIKLVSRVSKYQASKLNLLLGEFYRHGGQPDHWRSTWTIAVDEHSDLVAHKHLSDPAFWSQAAFLRPAGLPWSEVSIRNLSSALAALGMNASQNPPESIVWMTIGSQHLLRVEGHAAILAFKKAEAEATDAATIAKLRLDQARAMVIAGQPGPASAILFGLVSENSGRAMEDRATAILGALKLQNGGVAQGFNLLHSSIKTVDGWPLDERLRAQADYSLALLIRGQEEQGLALLDQVRREFESVQRFDEAHQCLWNKAKYFEETKQKDQLDATLSELQECETRLY